MTDRDLDSALEREIAEALDRLPAPRAPQTLLPRVLQATTLASRRPWYEQSWTQWPGEYRLVATALLCAGLTSVLFWLSVPEVLAAMRATVAGTLPAAVVSSLARAEAIIATGLVLWDALAAPFASAVAPIVLAMGFACAMFGAALRYVVLGGTSNT